MLDEGILGDQVVEFGVLDEEVVCSVGFAGAGLAGCVGDCEGEGVGVL